MKRREKSKKFFDTATIEGWYKVEKLYGNIQEWLRRERKKDENVLKRKVIRGGSWKDVGYYLQTSARTYEYQDTSKCYLGFRNVMTYLGRSKYDMN